MSKVAHFENLFKIYRDAVLVNYGDKCCKLYVLMFGLWLLSRFTPPLSFYIRAALPQIRVETLIGSQANYEIKI